MPLGPRKAETSEESNPAETESRQLPSLVVAALIAGLLIGGCGTVINALHSSGPVMTPYQADTLIYYQYARAIAEGHPYRFTADQLPSTGSTSHLYPAVLSVFYAVGARGEHLALASFLFGACCLTATLVCVAWIVRALRPDIGCLTLCLCALSGQLVMSALGESDITLFMPLALGAFAAALHRRPRTLAALLFACALCRPEGMVLSAVIFGGATGWLLLGRGGDWGRAYMVAGAVGLLGAATVFGLNWTLTGSVGFQSVHLKGHFAQFPIAGALTLMCRDLVHIFMEVLWGANRGFRSMYVMPVLGGALALVGLLSRSWEWSLERFCEACILLAALAATVLVAASGWEGLMYDRYFAWWIPIFLLYVSFGVKTVGEHLGRRVARGLWILLVGYQVVGFTYFASTFVSENLAMAPRIDFVRSAHQQLDPDASVGMIQSAGLAYYLPGRTAINVAGIESPDFIPRKHVVESAERLRHQPDLRFDYWLVSRTFSRKGLLHPLVGDLLTEEIMASEPNSAFGIYRPNWELLNHGAQPEKQRVRDAVAGMTLVDSLDVGYPPDEESHNRTVHTRLPSMLLDPFLEVRKISELDILEVGEAVIGSETFDVAAQPGKPLRLVMRTMSAVNVAVAGADGSKKKRYYALANPLRLLVQVDGQQTDIMAFPLTTEADQFDEIVIDIPGEMITRDNSRVTIGGDHMSCSFWAYQ